jgi:hypothetical protein
MARHRPLQTIVETVVRVPAELHRYRDAIPQGLHQIAIARKDLFAKLASCPRAERPMLKLRLTLDMRRQLEEIAAATRQPLWLVVTVALTCIRDAPAGVRSAALSDHRKYRQTPKSAPELQAPELQAPDFQAAGATASSAPASGMPTDFSTADPPSADPLSAGSPPDAGVPGVLANGVSQKSPG